MHRTARTATVAAALLLGASACSGGGAETVDKVDKVVDDTYQVTYEVTGKDVASIQYSAGEGTATDPKLATADKPALPWSKTVTLRGIMPPTVLPVAADAADTTTAGITCRIVYKGKTIAEKSGEDLATAGGCVAVSPVTG
ncbi:MmpS family transport accessory protein [Streptomyces sp. NPDC051183]|uniref:MmpS family transport accessory protein n=1 Tax=unclassified Streptomyces TaxID=2593676 RepID=UPI00343506F0